MRRFVPILLAFMLFVGTAYADTMYVLCRPKDYVNVRANPSTKSMTVGRLDCGDSIITDGETEVDKQGRKWIHVVEPRYESGDSWVCNMYLQETPISIERCTGYVVAKRRTALRRSPNGKRITWLKNGTEVSVLAMSEEWALTTRGYVKRESLEVTY